MTGDLEKWNEQPPSKLVDPEEIAARLERAAKDKRLVECNPDEAVRYREKEFYEYEDKRQYPINAWVDSSYLRAINIFTKCHPHTVRGNNQYIITSLGWMKIAENYYDEIAAIASRYDEIEESPDNYLYSKSQRRSKIEQVGSVTQRKINLTMAGKDQFDHLSERLGLTESGLFLVCFWECMILSPNLPAHLFQYGQGIQEQFRNHLKSRSYDLEFHL